MNKFNQTSCNNLNISRNQLKYKKSKDKKSNITIFKDVPNWYFLSSTPPYPTVE